MLEMLHYTIFYNIGIVKIQSKKKTSINLKYTKRYGDGC